MLFELIYHVFIFVEADIEKENTETNLLTTICNYPNNPSPGKFPFLTKLLDNFEVA